jgi:hypothetical protein
MVVNILSYFNVTLEAYPYIILINVNSILEQYILTFINDYN